MFTMRQKQFAIGLGLLLALVLSGCSPLIKIEQPAHSDFIQLKAGNTVGQTFVARYQGLEGVVLFLEPGQTERGTLRLHLKSGTQTGVELASASLPVQDISKASFYRFQFPALKDSQNQDYYAFLTWEDNNDSQGHINVGSGPADAYLSGSGYQNEIPQESQLTFRLVYDSNQALAGLIGQGLTWLVWLAVGLFLFILPGWAMLSLLWKKWAQLRWEEKLGLAGSLSVAIYPVLFLWSNLIGLHLGALYAWLPPIFSLAFLAWKNRAVIRHPRLVLQPKTSPGASNQPTRSRLGPSEILPGITLLAVLGLVFGVRFWVIRDLELPMWGDSYQHTMIAQLLVDHGGLFSSWQPYADLNSFTYHFGFHTLAAVFHWVSGLSLAQSVLWTGQILNGLAVLALYPLATRIGKNRWAGVAAVLVAGLLAPMPMFYTNWGRYTQLAGQVILISVIYLTWRLIEEEKIDWRLTALIWIAFGGLALAHYRVLIFGVIFVVALFLFYAWRTPIWRLVQRIFWAGFGAAVLYLPWFIHVFGGRILTIFARQITTPASQTSEFTQVYNAIGNLFTYLPAWLWLALLPIIAWGLWRKEIGAALICLWWFLVILAANPEWLNLPGSGALSNFAVFIAAYIPAGVLFGAAVGWSFEDLQRVNTSRIFARERALRAVRLLIPVGILVVFLTAGLWGTRQRRNDIQPAAYSLATRPDLHAFSWIEENTPQNAGFLVNSFLAYGGATVVGSDGGWWLPLLASRKTNLPPMTYGFERDPWPGYKESVKSLTTALLDQGIDDPEVLAMLAERNLTYVYVGQRQGSVNYPGPYPLAPQELLASQNFQPVYHQDRVWIFKLVSPQS
jgi:hypothetical protein